MKKRIFFIAILLFGSFLLSSCGIGITERTTFENIDISGNTYIRFHGVYLNGIIFGNLKRNVHLYPKNHNTEWIRIKIDPKLTGTLISVYPTFMGTLLYPIVNCEAVERVVIYVPNKKDQIAWEKWSKKVTREYREYVEDEKNKKKKAKITRIVPNI